MQAPLDPPMTTDTAPWFAVVVLLAALVGMALLTWAGLTVWHGVEHTAPARAVAEVLRA